MHFAKEKCWTGKKKAPWSQIRVITMFMFSPKALLKSNFLPLPKLGTIFWNAVSKRKGKLNWQLQNFNALEEMYYHTVGPGMLLGVWGRRGGWGSFVLHCMHEQSPTFRQKLFRTTVTGFACYFTALRRIWNGNHGHRVCGDSYIHTGFLQHVRLFAERAW